jgi:hypothetical protein
MATPYLESSRRVTWSGLVLAGLCAAALAGACASAGAARAGKAPPDLSGSWQVNEDLSRIAQQEMRRSGGDGPRGPGRMGGGRGGGMGRRRGGGGGGGEGHPGGPGGGPPGGFPGRPEGGPGSAGLAEAMETMTIAWAAPQLTVTSPGDRKRVFWTDGRKVREERPGGRTIKTRAHWSDNGALYVITRTGSGKRTEIFEISNDGRRLFVIIGVDGRGPRPMQLRRVYDRVTPPA